MFILIGEMKKLFVLLTALLLLTGCGRIADDGGKNGEQPLAIVDSMSLQYASGFSVDYYEEGYIHISMADGSNYVVVPENKTENNLGCENPVYIHRPCDRIYLAASSAMDLFLELDSLDKITACSTKASDYAMEQVRSEIEAGNIAYVGKYSAPDYELLLGRGCGLAIESTMISHSPKIKEQLERIGIPVLVERSSYEENPLGRLEWIKLYGVLTDNVDRATEFYDAELKKIESLEASTGNASNAPEVAFFSITSTGYVTVRKPGDYICKMIEMAGGLYALDALMLEEDNALSTVNIGMEEFYSMARDADILIYNGSIDGGASTLKELLDKNALLKDFAAVKTGEVYSTGLNMFQESSKIAQVIVEMSDIIGEGAGDGTYLKHLE